jgi:small subunit ribosomal protein S16
MLRMLSIRMQRAGRKGHPTYRVVVQDTRWAPTSGKFVASLGSYDPHTKTTTLAKEKAELFLKNGAQPSDRVIKLLTSEGVKMPAWVAKPGKQKRAIKNPDKLRRNRPPEPKVEEPAVSEVETSEAPAETPAAEVSETEVAAEIPAEEAAASEAKTQDEAVPAEPEVSKSEEPDAKPAEKA